MNQTQTSGWSPVVSAPDEEFASFLEFGDLQLNFPPFEGLAQGSNHIQQDVGIPMDTSMENATDILGYGERHVPQQLGHSTSNPLLNGYAGNQGHLFEMPAEHFDQSSHAFSKNMHQYGQGMVPPTPNSIEMHGGHPGYHQTPVHRQAHMYDYYQHNPRDQVRAIL